MSIMRGHFSISYASDISEFIWQITPINLRRYIIYFQSSPKYVTVLNISQRFNKYSLKRTEYLQTHDTSTVYKCTRK